MTRHQSMAQNLSDMECSTFEIDAAQLRFVTEIAPLQPFKCVWTETLSGMIFVAACEHIDIKQSKINFN